jgi:hypothetical protein
VNSRLSPRLIRRIVWLVFVAGIAGMIVASIKDSNGGAITAGMVTAVAALGLILITSVVPPEALARPSADDAEVTGHVEVDQQVAADVEARIAELVEAGADEEQVRRLVRRAVDLGAGTRSPSAP